MRPVIKFKTGFRCVIICKYEYTKYPLCVVQNICTTERGFEEEQIWRWTSRLRRGTHSSL